MMRGADGVRGRPVDSAGPVDSRTRFGRRRAIRVVDAAIHASGILWPLSLLGAEKLTASAGL